MNLTQTQKLLLERVINVFETGKPEGNYAALVIYRDGPHKIKQITYGRSQTTEYGNLRELVQKYVHANGLYSKQLEPFAELVGSVSLIDNTTFKDLLKKAGREDPIMRSVQDAFFEQRYFKPAMKWAKQEGIKEALSALVIYDSFIHSGSILWMIRNMFAESPPSLGGDEREWTKAYVNARHKWLSNHSNKLLHKTVYRMECFKREIVRSNWDLSKLPIDANGVTVSA